MREDMDKTGHKISKIAREAGRFSRKLLRDVHLGNVEYEYLKLVIKHPGISQSELCKRLNTDRGAVARITANLEAKGLITRARSQTDSRVKMIYKTASAHVVQESMLDIEGIFYEWLFEDIAQADFETFLKVLDAAHLKSKQERQENFEHLLSRNGQPSMIGGISPADDDEKGAR